MPPFFKQATFLLSLLLLGVSNIWAQSVFWSPSQGTLQQGKVNTIDLYFEGCEPSGDVTLPDLLGLSLSFRSTSTSRSIINGRSSSKVVYSYQAIPSVQGTVSIPSFSVATSEGNLRVPTATYSVVEATVGNTGASPSEVFLSRFQIRDAKIYEGEVFSLDYFAGAKQEYQLVDLSEPNWNSDKLVTAGLKETQSGSLDLEGNRYLAKAYQAKAMATESGIITLPAVTQTATVVVGRRRDFLFQEPVYDTYNIESEEASLEILPLPAGAPASFKGAVGSFSFESRVVPEEVQVGEPVTWTLELSGQGNWPSGIGVPQRSVSKNFRAIQPNLKTEFAENDLFQGTQAEDIVLIPTTEGSFDFGPIEFSYFDPEAGEYKTISIPAEQVTVHPATTNNQTSGPANPAQAFTPSDTDNYQTPAPSPTGHSASTKPPVLPEGPLSSFTRKDIPKGSVSPLYPTLYTIASCFLLWLLLAIAKCVRSDPRKENRAALKVLRAYAKRSGPSNEQEFAKMQKNWRKAAIAYFGLKTSEPSVQQVYESAEALGDASLASDWKKLWRDSDRFVFGSQLPSLSEWFSLYQKTILASPKPSFGFSRLFSGSTWLGLLILAFSLSMGVSESSAATATELYEQGNFSAAELEWRKAISENPEVVEYRYNAGLAASQQKQWGKAWAYWAGAFCLDPQNESVAWNLRIAHSNTGAYDETLQSLIEGESYFKIVRYQSPAEWENLSIYSLYTAGALLLACVVALYLRPLRRLIAAFLVLAVLSSVMSYFSLWAASKYGDLAQPDTFLVIGSTALNSIPSDLDEQQISSEVREGSIAKPLRSFLGWVRIKLPNDEKGWVRKEALMPLYGPLD